MLKEIIRQQIARDGYITIADYMHLCLLHPEHGYYTTQNVFGAAGDFTTAPETSQLFGEMIGVWVVLEWERLCKPDAFHLVELGPGRGTLMRDLLRAVYHVKGFLRGIQVNFIEASPSLQEQQKDSLRDFEIDPVWYPSIDAMDFDRPTIIIANEFFDVLPIQQFIVQNGVWHERVIVSDDDRFAWSVKAVETIESDMPDAAGLDDGILYERSNDSRKVFADLCWTIKQTSGAMVVIDYGDYVTPRLGDTLQSMKQHEFVDVLDAWDHADITAHVDFQTLEMLARKEKLKTAFLLQREFLKLYGIDVRAERLTDSQPLETQAVIKAGYDRLMDLAQMGQLFKVLIVQSHDPYDY